MNRKKWNIPGVSSNSTIYIVVLIIFGIAAWVTGQPYLAAAEIMAAGFLIIYYIRSNSLRNEEAISYLENLAFYVDSATRDSVLNFPLPMVVIGSKGGIIWYNGLFASIVDGENVFERSIQDIMPDVSIEKIISQENCCLHTMVGSRHYDLVGNIVHSTENKEEYSIVLYLVDRTEQYKFEELFEGRETISAVVMIDNYDEIMQYVNESERHVVIAAIEHKIGEWVGSMQGVSTKQERDKYYVVFDSRTLDQQIGRRFDVLSAVEQLELESRIHATLSIGIGRGGGTIAENYAFARAAVEMALGRGGNQAVVKENERFHFFGGQTHEVEKRTKVKPRVIAHALLELVQQAENVLIMGHMSADADSIGAAVGLSRILRNLGHRTNIVLEKKTCLSPTIVDSIENNSDIFVNPKTALELCTGETLLIIVDTHKETYVECPKLLKLTEQVVIIDHHRKAADYIEAVLTYLEPFASSTCEMVTEILPYMEKTPNLHVSEAQALYAGITLDTKNFTVKTGVRTFEAASILRRMGVDTVAVKKMFQNDMPAYVKRAKIVVGAKLYSRDVAMSIFDGHDSAPNILISQAADELLNIAGVNASFVLCQSGGTTLISGRSLGGVNVQVILETLGGGGHLTVAGAQLKETKVEDAMKQLKKAIDNYKKAQQKD